MVDQVVQTFHDQVREASHPDGAATASRLILAHLHNDGDAVASTLKQIEDNEFPEWLTVEAMLAAVAVAAHNLIVAHGGRDEAATEVTAWLDRSHQTEGAAL